jgi:hypothetical protein
MHKQIIKAIFDDFDSFFLDVKHENYRYIFNKKHDLKVYKTGKKSYLNIPDDIKYLDIDIDEEKVYLLFLIGHEIAHLANKHLDYKDKNSFDTCSIEMWADFFGAKISMSILLNGKNFNQLVNSDLSNPNKGLELLSYMLNKINAIYKNTNGSEKYLDSNSRLSTTISGIIAYLTRDEMWRTQKFTNEDHAKIGVKWGMLINRKLFELNTFSNICKDFEDKEKRAEADSGSMNLNIVDIHQKIKSGTTGYLIKGLRLKYNFILDSYYGTYRRNMLLVEEINAKYKELGWDMKLN